MVDVVDPRIPPHDVVILATDEGTYTVDRTILAGRGKLFDTFFTNTSSKAKTLHVLMPEPAKYILEEAAPATVGNYIDYVKSGAFGPVLAESEDKHAPYVDQIENLIDIHLYASQIEDRVAQDDTMDCLLATYKDGGSEGAWLPDIDVITRVYSAGRRAQTLRKFLVDVHIWAGKVGEKRDRDHKEFLTDLRASIFDHVMGVHAGKELYDITKGYMGMLKKKLEKKPEKKQQGIPVSVKCCDYHKHGPGAECGNKKRKRPVEILDDSEGEAAGVNPAAKKAKSEK